MIMELTERLLFPAGRGFVPFPVRRCVLRLLEHRDRIDPALTQEVYRVPADATRPPRAWQTASGMSWLRLEAALSGAARAETAQDWLALNGPCESPAEEAFVTDVVAPVLGVRGLRALHAQEVFPLPDGGTGRIDFVLVLNGVRVAVEVDGIEFHEGPGVDGLRPEHERDRQNALVAAGYVLLRYTAREILQDAKGTAKKLVRDLDALGLIGAEEGNAHAEPLSISAGTHSLLGPWPRDFVRAQQASLDLLRSAPGWLSAVERTIVVPRSDLGATVMGLLDVLDVCASAQRLLGHESTLRRVSVWVGDHRDIIAALVHERVTGSQAPQLPFDVDVLDGPTPDGADLLLISASADDLTDGEVTRFVEGLDRNARIVWCSDVDAPNRAAPTSPPAYFSQPARPVVEHLLERFFGFPEFRDGQWEIVEQLLKGTSTLGVLPTGAGKTVCFQLPALLQPGLSIVVSPLVSLMDDQVMNLRAIGLDFAGRAHSRLSEDEAQEEIRRFKAGSYKLFYVSPERFHSQKFVNQLANLVADHGIPISYFVVDEAHLASEWGHDFRPSYLTLPDARERLSPKAPIALLTATAPRQIRDDLAAIFRNSCTLKMVLPPTFDRPELSFEVRRVRDDEERQRAVLDLVRSELPKSLGHADFFDLHGVGPGNDRVVHGGLVFTPWGKPGPKRPAIRAANLAQVFGDAGLPAAEYRSSSSDTEHDDRGAINRHTQERFKRNELPLVIATKGFGTGIDKPDIRYVVHADMPGSLEALYQEAGRAGRDGQDARSAMIWRPRVEACRPGKSAPMCAATGGCPHGLEELCSFGIQARLRSGNQPGASAEIETSLTLWRAYFAKRLADDQVTVPRSLEVDAITRPEIMDCTEDILRRLSDLELCGVPSVPRDPEKPIFVESRLFSADVVRQRVRALRPGTRPPQGPSDESFITDAVKLAFGLTERDAQGHTAVWAMYLRGRQLNSEKKAPVPRSSALKQAKQRPDVERFLARLVTLGVARTYRYEGMHEWGVELGPKEGRKVSLLARQLTDAVGRHHGAITQGDPLPKEWPEAVEAALTRLIQSWYDTIAVRSWETLESLEEFAGARDCRRRRIAQYMNESAVSIASPCGHCDNCGIQPLGDLRPATVDEQVQQRVVAFNVAFDALVAAPDRIDAVEPLLLLAREERQLEAVRDRAARHLERSPFDVSPRLAAAIAAHELDEPHTAERHVRMLFETLGSADADDRLLRVAQLVPASLLCAVLPDLDRLLAGVDDGPRDLIAYRLEHRVDQERAAVRAAAVVRRAAAPLRELAIATRRTFDAE
jgi:superfamily II DNA helicase RecQ